MTVPPSNRLSLVKPSRNGPAIVLRTVLVRADGRGNRTEVAEGHEVMPGCSVIELPGHSAGSMGLLVETADGPCIVAGASRSMIATFGFSASTSVRATGTTIHMARRT